MLPKFSSKAFLAPMAGVSDPALRLQCKQMGAGLVVTEFTNIHSIIAKEKQLKENMKTIQEFIEYSEQERPISIQLFGSDLFALEQAVKIVGPYFDIIDYNMGCPAPHITKQMAGGALLQEVNLTQQIFRTLVDTTKKPITLKIRSGVTDASRFLFREIAKIAENEGIQMITFHPRTVSQGYSGNADWDLIKELKEISNIPIVGNGDISTPEDAKTMMDETGCDYVMIGRAAMGNPFIFEQVNDYLNTGSFNKYTFEDKLDSFFDYLRLTKKFKIKFSNIKSQAMRFTKGMKGGSQLRSKITFSKNIDDLEKIMNDASTNTIIK
ncbi:MAG: tRNA dihydrouridine synthase DusB [Nitrosopumilus sp.]